MTVLRRREPIPLYFQLETLLREQIELGHYGPGEALPSENELAVHHAISRVTVRAALRRLEEDGLVSRERGRGTFVAPDIKRSGKIVRDLSNLLGFEDELRRLGLDPECEVLAIEEVSAAGHIAELMQVAPHTDILRVWRRGASQGQPLWLESRYFPADVGQALVASGGLASTGIMRLLERQLGQRIEAIRIELAAAIATDRQAQLLQLPPTSAVQVYEATAQTEAGRVVQFVRVIFPAGHFRLTFQVSRSPDGAYEGGQTSVLTPAIDTIDAPWEEPTAHRTASSTSASSAP